MGNEVEEIKKKLDIVETINRLLPLKKRGRHFVANCPFHNEKTPSFVVSPELQIYKCFGCGKAGDIFSFYEEFNRVTFREALEDLAKIAGVKLTESKMMDKEEGKKKRLELINREVVKFYTYILQKHPLGKTALDYLLNRNINAESQKLFGIGYSPTDSRLISSYLLKKNFSESELIESGTFGKSRYGNQLYDRFSGRLVFPLIDYRDKIVGFSGRILPGVKKELAKYINSPETILYHKSQTVFGINLSKEAIKKEDEVIVVEGEFDMISPYQAGIKNIVAIKGTAFTEDQIHLLKRYTKTLVLALDSDFAGNKAAFKSIEIAEKADMEIKVARFGENFKDPDEAVNQDKTGFLKAIKEAIPVWDFIIETAVKNHKADTIGGKKEILRECLPFINRIENEVIRSDYLKKLADAIGSQTEAVKAEAKKMTEPPKTPEEKKEEADSSSRRERNEKRLLELVLGAKKPPKVVKKIQTKIEIKTKSILKIMEIIVGEKFDWENPLSNISEELKDIFSEAYIRSREENLESVGRRYEIGKIIAEIKINEIKEKMETVTSNIGRFEKEENELELANWEKQYDELINELSKWQKQRKW